MSELPPPSGDTSAKIDLPVMVEPILERLGPGAVLLPIDFGQKRPSISGWQKKTIADMRNQAYVDSLMIGNIGVLLGKASGGICAIDIDDDLAADEFLALNPLLAGTLRTRGLRGCQLWLQMIGDYPEMKKIATVGGDAWGEWRADGGQSVIHGTHPCGDRYQIVVDAKPVLIEFDQIVWPADLKLPWVDEGYRKLVAEYGDPFFNQGKAGVGFNELALAALYCLEHLILCEPTEGRFYQYDESTGLWQMISEDKLKTEIGKYLKKIADRLGMPKLTNKAKAALYSAILSLIRGQAEHANPFEGHSSRIHVKNGVLELEGQLPGLYSFDPAYYSRNRSPIAYDENAQCPRFLKELLHLALDDADISLLQRWCGSVLLGKNDAQKLMLLIGTPGGGKSTLVSIIEQIIGLINVMQLRTKHLDERFEASSYIGKTLLAGKDVNGNFLAERGAHVIKALLGGDLMNAEFKNGNDRVQFRGDFNIVITCNSRLMIKFDGDADAWRRRLLVINYEQPKPEKPIRDFAGVLLREEASGILNWMIEGAILHLEEISQAGATFVLTEEQQGRIDNLISESDSLRLFVRERIEKFEGGGTTADELKQAYLKFCESRGWQPQHPRSIERDLPGLMMEYHGAHKRHDIKRMDGIKRGYVGVALVEEAL